MGYLGEVLELRAQGVCPGGLENNRTAFSASISMTDAVPGVWRDLLFDPQTSGGLLIALPQERARAFMGQFAGQEAVLVGRVVKEEQGNIVVC